MRCFSIAIIDLTKLFEVLTSVVTIIKLGNCLTSLYLIREESRISRTIFYVVSKINRVGGLTGS